MMIQGVDVSNVMTYLLNELSCTMEYNWNPEFCHDELKSYYKQAQKEMRKLDFTKLNKGELSMLGFRKFDVDSNLYCVPMWLFKCLPKGTKLISIFGEECVVGKDHIDDDTRGGLLAYGLEINSNV